MSSAPMRGAVRNRGGISFQRTRDRGAASWGGDFPGFRDTVDGTSLRTAFDGVSKVPTKERTMRARRLLTTRPLTVCLTAFVVAVVALPSLAQNPSRVFYEDLPQLVGDLAAESRASQLPIGTAVVIDRLDLGGELAALELERFSVWTADARIRVHSDQGVMTLPAPSTVSLRGFIAGDPSSHAALNLHESGELRGMLARRGQYWLIGQPDGVGSAIVVREVDVENELDDRVQQFTCGTESLGARSDLNALFGSADPAFDAWRAAQANPRGVSHTARVAVETDFEYYSIFGNVGDATDYVTDIFTFISGVYESEIDTDLQIPALELHTTAADPWAQFGTTCGLMEFGLYWNTNFAGVDRTVAHMLSGKNNGGGVAWVGVLCSDPFSVTLSNFGLSCPPLANTANYGGGYGYTGTIDGNFNINAPVVLWDIVATAHEIGHNFNSPHTHCYAGLGGNASPVDTCYNGQCGGAGCWCGGTSLPGVGPGTGTIMSYCHLLGGGMSNITMTFGEGHPFGTAPERVGARMQDHVAAASAGDPACLAPWSPSDIFTDGFESGDTMSWSTTTP
ncbi:MAG: hypothetical protein DWQ36_14260 [Acidobacteria bacterium]|nr:MAG: hypothetical protein DWQ36_14260 [Acidobacteriota bacterium]